MNKLKVLIPILLVLLLLAAVPALSEEAENLTESLTVKVVDKAGKVKAITDGKYTTYWESSSVKNPWVVISCDKPIYGLYLCFQKMPDSYVIQKQSGEEWVTLAEGGEPRFHHVFFELDGVNKIRILSTMEKKNVMGFNEIYAFGEGRIPDWVQRWKEPSGNADILFLATHPDDDVLFLGSAITWYAAEEKKNVQVAYLTSSNTTRRSEALNGLWAMGVRNYPEFGTFSDKYSNPARIDQEYKDMGGQDKVLSWVTEVYRKYRPAVVVTQDIDGEYGHPQHKMMVDAAIKCWDTAADGSAYPESAEQYGTWEVKKLYLHLYGGGEESTVFNWDAPMESMGGKTANEAAEDAFAYHVTQAGKGNKFNGVRVPFSVAEYGVKRYPNNRFGLYATRVGQDVTHTDFLENIEGTAEAAEPADESSNDEEEVPAEEPDAPETETPAEEPEEDPDEPETPEAQAEEQKNAGTGFRDVTAPDWADVQLNGNGFLDEGEYVFADSENGHYMYVSRTLRIVIERSYEVPDKKHPFYCFTANVWCDVENGEYPQCVFNNPDPGQRNKSKNFAFIKDIALNNHAVLATSTDYYTYRISQTYPTGIEIRNGEIIIDDPRKLQRSMPTYETLALYRDGHAESWTNEEKTAEQYIQEGALQVYTFGPCLVKDGELTDYILNHSNASYNPRLAVGVSEPGHYVLVMCEGRIARSKGVQMRTLANMMLERGCRLAVNLDGGQSAVMTFMGEQLNRVVKSDPKGRLEGEILAFGFSDQVGSFEIPGAYDFEIAK